MGFLDAFLFFLFGEGEGFGFVLILSCFCALSYLDTLVIYSVACFFHNENVPSYLQVESGNRV
jgi:hypothetical protein